MSDGDPADASCPRKGNLVVQMRAAAHGQKWLCDQCGTKFYDLKNTGPKGGAVCPECGTELHRTPKLPPGARSSARRQAKPVRPAPVKPAAQASSEDDAEEEIVDDEDNLLEPDNDDDDNNDNDDGDGDEASPV